MTDTKTQIDKLDAELKALAESVTFWRLQRNHDMYKKYKVLYTDALIKFEALLKTEKQ